MLNINYSLTSLKSVLENIKPSKIVLVSSDKLISKLDWAVSEIKELAPSKIKLIQVPDGEPAKEWNVLETLLKEFVDLGLDRKSVVIGLGGGSISDLVGFASSIYQRGIFYINIPTTLLAQVDSSIGGKTAVNFLGYKNQIGTFYNPIATIIDLRFLKTLNENQVVDGFAEIIKAGLIKDSTILEIIKPYNLTELKNAPILKETILKSIKVKEYFVEKDPNDKNIRQILNFGHTIAHALELKYEISHGKAVLIGMIEELKLGEALKETERKIRDYLEFLLENMGISFDKKQFKIDWEFILHDKKVSGGKINLPIIKRLGEAELIKVEIDKIMPLIK